MDLSSSSNLHVFSTKEETHARYFLGGTILKKNLGRAKINRTGENRDFQRGYPAENRNKGWRDWNTCRRGTRGKPVSPNTWFSSVYSVTGREILDRPPRSHPRSFFERLIFRTLLSPPVFGRRTTIRNIAGRVSMESTRSSRFSDLFPKIWNDKTRVN